MDINKLEVKRIAKLAGLSFSEKVLELYQKDLINIVNLFDKLKEVNTDGIDPLYNVIDDNLRLREDRVVKDNTREEVMKNAPRNKYGFFVVPKMIE